MDSDCRYDLKGFSDLLGLPIENIADLFSDLTKEINSEVFKLKTYLCEKDLDQLKQINHNIKGISANYRILDIYEETLEISNALTNITNGDFMHIESLFNNFFVICENAIKEIACYFEQKGFVI
ncbi:MAG: Hpt domain-containing protein [Desulfosporosinus sp.]|nr:Hpt domain-containing protein [Desulfosporosinus sp.]